MKTTVAIGNYLIEYTRRHNPRSKRIRLAVHPGGEIFVTAPRSVSEEMIHKFMFAKAKWILSKVDYLKKFSSQSKTPAERAREYREHKAKALEIVKDRIAHFNTLYNFRHGRISIKNHKTMWGSCSRQGNLNFNYRIALVPQRFSDYVIVHELCHLKEFNHSQRFWDLVARTIPDHKEVRKELKRLGLRIG